MNSDEIRKVLEANGMWEISEVRVFDAYMKTKDGQEKHVTVKVLDMGSGKPGHRYNLIVTDDSGNEASGNGAETIEAAAAIVHWQELDLLK